MVDNIALIPRVQTRMALILPEEYHQHLFFAEESVEALRDKILEICENPQDELDAFGKKASDFICQQKNAVVQAGRLVEFINNL